MGVYEEVFDIPETVEPPKSKKSSKKN